LCDDEFSRFLTRCEFSEQLHTMSPPSMPASSTTSNKPTLSVDLLDNSNVVAHGNLSDSLSSVNYSPAFVSPTRSATGDGAFITYSPTQSALKTPSSVSSNQNSVMGGGGGGGGGGGTTVQSPKGSGANQQNTPTKRKKNVTISSATHSSSAAAAVLTPLSPLSTLSQQLNQNHPVPAANSVTPTKSSSLTTSSSNPSHSYHTPTKPTTNSTAAATSSPISALISPRSALSTMSSVSEPQHLSPLKPTPTLKHSNSLTDTSSLDQSPICGTIWMQNKTLSTIKKYKKRFLVLQHKKLQIFKTDLEFKPRFIIPLNNVTIVPTKPKKFHIQTGKKTFKFKCVSEEQRTEWLEHLCREQSEKNVEQMRELILRRILAWNEEQQRIQFSIQQKQRLQQQQEQGNRERPVTNENPTKQAMELNALHFCPLSITGLREIHKSMDLLQFLTHEEIYCVLTKTLRDLTLIDHKQVTVKKIQIALTGNRTDEKYGIESCVDDQGELLLVFREGFLYPKQEVLEKLLTWKYEPSNELKSWASKLTEILDVKLTEDTGLDTDQFFDEDEDGSSTTDMVGLDNSSAYTLGSLSNRTTRSDSPYTVRVKFAITESDTSLNEQRIEENLSRLTQHFKNMKERDSYVFKLSAELLGSIVVTNDSVSFFSRRGEVIIENFSTQNKQLPSLLVNNQRIMDLVLRHKIGKLEEILAELTMKSESICSRKIIFSLGGDIRARAAARVSSPRPVHPSENADSDNLSSDDRIQLAFVQLVQRLINEVPNRYRLKMMKNIDEVVISMQTTKIQENLFVDGVLENKGRFQLTAEELKQTLKQMNKQSKLAMSLMSHKHKDNVDTTSESTTATIHRDSLSESSEHLSERDASIDLSNDDDEHVHAYLKKNFSKQFSLSEREVDQIVSEALKQLRKMWQQPQHEYQLERFIHDYIELVDLDQSLVSKLYQMTLDRRKTLNQKGFEFRTVALCLLSETLPQIVQDNLSRRRDIVLFGLKGSGKTQLLYKLKFNKNVKTSPSVGIQQEVVAFQDLNLMIYDIGGQTKEKDALKFFTKHRHDRVDGLIFMIDAVTFMSNKEQVSTLLLRYVKKVMKINNTPASTQGGTGQQGNSTQGEAREGTTEASNSSTQNNRAHHAPHPLLILLNKVDQPNTVGESTVEHQMEPALQKLTSKWGITWKIQPTSILRGDGLYEGLSYLYAFL